MLSYKGKIDIDSLVNKASKKHKVSVDKITKQLKLGTDVEKEHTDSVELAAKIAMDHIMEIPDYYTKLKKVDPHHESVNEARVKSVAFTFGRFNPPTIGHGKLVKKVLAAARGGDHFIFPSHSEDAKRNPLSHKQKVKTLRQAFKGVNIVDNSAIKNPFIAAEFLAKKGYQDITLIVGQDRVANFKKELGPWLQKNYKGVKFNVVSAGQRDPDAEGVEGMSASKMRQAAADDDYHSFALGVPRQLTTRETEQLFRALRKGMKLEGVDHNMNLIIELVLGDLWKQLKSGDMVWSYDILKGNWEVGAYPSASHEMLNSKLLRKGRYRITDEDELEDFYSENFINGYTVKNNTGISKVYVYDMYYNSKYGEVPTRFMKQIERKFPNFDIQRIQIKENAEMNEKYKRDYRKEYDNYHKRPEQRERNASRKRARRALEREGIVKKFDRKDVHHRNHNAMDNSKRNLAVTDISSNRADNKSAVHGGRIDYSTTTESFTGLKSFNELNEKQIVFNGGKRSGQVVFLAGGAGSGKGFAASQYMDKKTFKVRDVDEWKKAFIELDKRYKKYPEVRGLNLKNPEDVGKLHMFVRSKGIKNKTLNLLLSDLRKGDLPNIMFDVTMKEMEDMTEVIPKLLEVGYEPRNIHLVWVLTNYKVAVVRNKTRERVVPDDIMLATHQGAASTVTELLGGNIPRGFDGGVYVVLNNSEHTVFYVHPKTGKPLDGRDGRPMAIKDFMYLKLKDPGRALTKMKSIKQTLWTWIKDNVPKGTELKDIFSDKNA